MCVLPTVLQIQQSILSQSSGNQLLQRMFVSYGSGSPFHSGVGKPARADARIILEGIRTTTTTQSRTSQSNYVVWQRQINQGSTGETLTLPSFTGPSSDLKGSGVALQIRFRLSICLLIWGNATFHTRQSTQH